jgi:hypothetical protein
VPGGAHLLTPITLALIMLTMITLSAIMLTSGAARRH